ncbi:hypothetical protein P168DRAFT_288358 [Aspergillus campestris IBT 28561]|uniref:Uncharacterized protein n=1 Tax=Aspergillus campestris (strain IBT 28561) TaxID=1392248 RepID=A0A2I1D954_ASPC2|nr:uncharacterized protein P168DRAFT_288358 [Aspergillus campestris IBT 28561]PKY06412.1 hypothetical protein P168DRAFT_288358 [Aspergillus campestris IBT 28561]
MPSAKPSLPPLRTPKTMTFPSELRADTGSSLSDNVKHEDGGMSTPITPPAAYTEFLKAFTPIFSSPSSANVNFSRMSFDRPPAYSPTSQPASALPGVSFSSCSSASSAADQHPKSAKEAEDAEGERGGRNMSCNASLPPPTPFTAPPVPNYHHLQLPPPGPVRRDPRSLRSLRIPPALRYSPTTPVSAADYSFSPHSATMLRSPYSPADWKLRYYEGPRSATTSSKVSVRHVVTHTVTYKRTQLDAPPKGKRRKCHDDDRTDPEAETEGVPERKKGVEKEAEKEKKKAKEKEEKDQADEEAGEKEKEEPKEKEPKEKKGETKEEKATNTET